MVIEQELAELGKAELDPYRSLDWWGDVIPVQWRMPEGGTSQFTLVLSLDSAPAYKTCNYTGGQSIISKAVYIQARLVDTASQQELGRKLFDGRPTLRTDCAPSIQASKNQKTVFYDWPKNRKAASRWLLHTVQANALDKLPPGPVTDKVALDRPEEVLRPETAHKAVELARYTVGDDGVYSSAGKCVALWNDGKRTVSIFDFETFSFSDIDLDRPVVRAAFSPDGRMAAFVADGQVSIVDLSTKSTQLKLPLPSLRVTSLKFSPDGRYLLSVSDDYTFTLIDIPNGGQEIIFEKRKGSTYYNNAFSPDGRFLALGETNSSTLIWDIGSRKEHLTIPGIKNGGAPTLFFIPDSAQLITTQAGVVTLFDIASGKTVRQISPGNGFAHSVRILSDGKTLVIGFRPSQVWDLESQKLIVESRDAVVSPDQNAVAWVTGNNTIEALNVITGQKTTLGEIDGEIRTMIYSSDNLYLFIQTKDGTVSVWDTVNARKIQTLQSVPGNLQSVVLSPDKSLVAASYGNPDRIVLWDLFRGNHLRDLPGKSDRFYSLKLSPDGKLLWATSALSSNPGNFMIQVWGIRP
jgi:WD40 repeat protein